jgi:hypothetical protein
MNQRIQELIRQSAVPADQAKDYALSNSLIEPTEKLDVAKFAELIVKECMNVLHDNELWNRHISHVLKEHFGVEQ